MAQAEFGTRAGGEAQAGSRGGVSHAAPQAQVAFAWPGTWVGRCQACARRSSCLLTARVSGPGSRDPDPGTRGPGPRSRDPGPVRSGSRGSGANSGHRKGGGRHLPERVGLMSRIPNEPSEALGRCASPSSTSRATYKRTLRTGLEARAAWKAGRRSASTRLTKGGDTCDHSALADLPEEFCAILVLGASGGGASRLLARLWNHYGIAESPTTRFRDD